MDGFEYQLDVSVFFALRLLLITKAASRITLEPDNDEDLEAELDQSRVEPHAELDGADRLIVQVKLRETDAWSVAAFKTLLQSRPRRLAAEDHLKDPGVRFLLVTTAAVNEGLSNLKVGDLEERPQATPLPATLAEILPTSALGRIAIYAGLSERQLHLEVGDTLQRLLHVPAAQLEACRTRLREDARRRMRGRAAGAWTREELVDTIKQFGGMLASAPNLDAFVPPSNFPQMRAALEAHGAVVITGPSGSGKTWAAMKLCEEAVADDPRRSLKILDPGAGPSVTRSITEDLPSVFYLEDPWGQYSLLPAGQAWSAQLPRILPDARPGRQFVVTTRTDMLDQANAVSALARWTIALEAEHYVDGPLETIYDNRVTALPTARQMLAFSNKGHALERLATPLELDLFFNTLAEPPLEGDTHAKLLARAFAKANRDTVEADVHGYLADLATPREAAILWALLTTWGQVSRAQLVAVQQALRRHAGYAAGALVKLVDRLVATRHLRQPGQVVSYRHPSTREALESYLVQNGPDAVAAFEDLLGALTAAPGADGWAIETAVRCLPRCATMIRSFEDGLTFAPPAVAVEVVDRWLDAGLAEPDARFAELLELAADAGSPACVAAETARFLLRRVQRGGEHFNDQWTPWAVNEVWLERMEGRAELRAIIDRFVRERLPIEDDGFPIAFVDEWRHLAGDLTEAFLVAAKTTVEHDLYRNADVIAKGASADLDRFDPVAQAALAQLARIRDSWGDDSELARKVRDHEVDTAYAEHFGDPGYPEGQGLREIIEGFVTALREQRGWSAIAAHPQAEAFASAWSTAVSRDAGSADPEELAALLDHCTWARLEGSAWTTLVRHWRPELRSRLQRRLAYPAIDASVEVEVALCALVNAPELIGERLSQAGDTAAVTLIAALHAAVRRQGVRTIPGRLRQALRQAPPEIVAILPALPRGKRQARPVHQGAIACLEAAVAFAPIQTVGDLVEILIASGRRPLAAVARWLHESEDPVDVVRALEAGAAMGSEYLLRQGLLHPVADARSNALRLLTDSLPTPLPPNILAMANDKGSGVRRALIETMAPRPHPEHLGILLRFLNDTWSNAEPQYDEAPHYQVAHDALRALGAYADLPADLGETLLALASATPDPILRDKALTFAAQRCGAMARRAIWKLAWSRPGGWDKIAALEALTSADTVEPAILKHLKGDFAHRLSPPYAVAALRLHTAHASDEAVLAMADALAADRRRRALVLVLADRAKARDTVLAASVMSRLPSDHPAQALLASDRKRKLPASVLDDLGDVRIRASVRRQLERDIERP
ncbi:hypothetical protein [Caulobacter rhizosphaerae]|uniref:nSTAND3 domain-containing NTPase n=1 Tax=Caulobacter rhizosphaerae TaxID=2010972 RepID=UPI0013D2CD9A|nr:hypothetical protein [Caulobacter rhizosphaerae]